MELKEKYNHCSLYLEVPTFTCAKLTLKTVMRSLLELNLFKSPYNDAYGRRSEVLSTYVYIIFMSVCFIILTIYAALIQHTQTIQIPSPSISTYRALENQYGAEISCPCSKITALYNKFISMKPVGY